MATGKLKPNRNVKGGERHIDVSSKLSREELDGKHSKDGARVQPPLVNLQTKHIPSAATVKQTMKLVSARDKSDGVKKNLLMPVVIPESAEAVYGAPELHSTLRVGKALFKARNKKPNLPQLVEDKLQSPTTESRFKKQVWEKLLLLMQEQTYSYVLLYILCGTQIQANDYCYDREQEQLLISSSLTKQVVLWTTSSA